MIKLTVRKNWNKLDKDFNNWYNEQETPYRRDWKFQKKWLSKELVKRKFVNEENLDRVWVLFSALTENCSSWKVQTKILSLVTLCLDRKEDLVDFIN